MSNTNNTTTQYQSVGIIVGRMQVHNLHDGHKALMDKVLSRHKKVFVFLGVASVPTDKNPLDFPTRAKMIYEAYPNVTVCPIADVESDELWCKNIDNLIKCVEPKNKVLLYGSRDSFIKYYKPYGRFETVEMMADVDTSGTESRLEISNEVRGSSDFRAGQIYQIYNRYGIIVPTVDVIVTDEKVTKILLGQKHAETQTNKWRIPGGYIEKKHNGALNAGIAEVSEETGLHIFDSEMNFVGQYNIDDWRYRGTKDCIMTTLFHAKMENQWNDMRSCSIPRAGDDLAEVKWFDINEKELYKVINPTHKHLIESFLTYIKK